MLLAASKSGGSSAILLIYVVLFGALYFFYLRPRSRRQKGQRAQTIGGFVGVVVKREDDLVTLRSAGGAELDFVPSAIAKRFDPVVPESSDDDVRADGDDTPPAGGSAPEGDK